MGSATHIMKKEAKTQGAKKISMSQKELILRGLPFNQVAYYSCVNAGKLNVLFPSVIIGNLEF